MVKFHTRIDKTRKFLGTSLFFAVYDYEMGADEYENSTPQVSQVLKSIYCADTFRPYRAVRLDARNQLLRRVCRI